MWTRMQVELLLGKAYSEWGGHSGDAVAVYDGLISSHPDDFRGYLAKVCPNCGITSMYLIWLLLTVHTGLCLLSCVMCDRVFCLKTKGRQVMQNACSFRWVIVTLNSNLCSLSLTRSSKHGCCVWWQSQICYKAPMSLRSFWLVVWGYYWGDVLCFLCCCRHVILHQEKQKHLLTNIQVDEIQWEQSW
jgi:hypothetical protein